MGELDRCARSPMVWHADLVAAPPPICEELDVTVRLPAYAQVQHHEADASDTAAGAEEDNVTSKQQGTCGTVVEESLTEDGPDNGATRPKAQSPLNDEFAGKLSAKLQVLAVDLDKRKLAEAELQAFEEQRRAWDFVGAEAQRAFAGMAGDAEATNKQKEDATALVLMGFQAGHAYEAVTKASNLEEAANLLLEKQSPTPSVWQSIVNWFGFGDDSSKAHRPGKYRIHDFGATVKPAEGSSFEDTVHGIGVQGAKANRLEIGATVDVVEVRTNGDEVQGRMANGNWISICSGDRVFARRVPLSAQLRELGYSEAQARDAEARCSTIWSAVEYISKKHSS